MKLLKKNHFEETPSPTPLQILKIGDMVTVSEYYPDGKGYYEALKTTLEVSSIHKVTFDGVDEKGNLFRVYAKDSWVLER